MCIFLSIEKARNRQSGKFFHDHLKTEESITFCHSSEILAVFVGKAVEKKGSEFIHPLAVHDIRVSFQKNVDDPGNAVIVVCFSSFFLRKMNFAVLNSISFCFVNINLELLLEKQTIRLGSSSIFLNNRPYLSILEQGFPFGLFQNIERMIKRLLFQIKTLRSLLRRCRLFSVI